MSKTVATGLGLSVMCFADAIHFCDGLDADSACIKTIMLGDISVLAFLSRSPEGVPAGIMVPMDHANLWLADVDLIVSQANDRASELSAASSKQLMDLLGRGTK